MHVNGIGRRLDIAPSIPMHRCAYLNGSPIPDIGAHQMHHTLLLVRGININFPDSANAVICAPTFGDYEIKWMERVRPNLEASTLNGYVKKLNRYWLPALTYRPITEITPGELLDIAAGIEVAAKTHKDSPTPCRSVFAAAIDDGIIDMNPADRLKSRRRVHTQPDPVTPSERVQILDWLKTNEPHWWPYFALAFDTGMRTSELNGLEWKSIDRNSGYLRVEQAWVQKRMKAPKTHEIRDIELGALAQQALAAQRSKTQQITDETRNLVLLDTAGKIIINDKPPRLAWGRALRSLGIRHRPAYNTRHTFATDSLMAGAKIGWISSKLGHDNIHMTLTRYARWIDKLDKCSERAKLDRWQISKD